MSRPVDPKTKTLYVYVRPKNWDYVKAMKEFFKSESNYVDALITKDRRFDTLKRMLLKKLGK